MLKHILRYEGYILLRIGVCVCFHHPHHFKLEHARVERVYEELGSLGILVAVATFQTVLSSDLGSQGE